MKRISAILLALCLLLAPCAFAQSLDTNVTTNNGEGKTTVNYTLPASFIVVIPASVTIDPTSGTGSLTLSLSSKTVFDVGQTITVKLTGATYYNDTDNTFHMKDTQNNDLVYTIKDAGGNSITKETNKCTVANWTVNAVADAELTLTATGGKVAGIYSDSLTFTVSSQMPTP